MSVQDGGEMGHLKVRREDTGIGVRLLEWVRHGPGEEGIKDCRRTKVKVDTR